MAIINQSLFGGSKILGGGGPGMYSIVLPRSVYWQSASEWIQVNSQQPEGQPYGRQQVVCNGKLWVMGAIGSPKIVAVDLTSGETVDEISSPMLGNVQTMGTVGTDGRRYIWVGSSCTGQTLSSFLLYQIDVLEKTVSQVGGISYPRAGQGYASLGPIVYSRKYNAVFVFGFGDHNGAGHRFVMRVNLSDQSVVQVANTPNTQQFGYGWSDEETGDIYTGGGYQSEVYRFTPESNTFTKISDTLTGLPASTIERTFMTVGDTVYCVSDQGIIPLDPKTGQTREGVVPTNPGFKVYYGWCAVDGNTLYISHSTGLYKCVLYENLPAEAPIVAKIYKGNKFHSTQPFTIHGEDGDLQVTTVQQTADKDIPIKMYTYDNAGGQVLIIEAGGNS